MTLTEFYELLQAVTPDVYWCETEVKDYPYITYAEKNSIINSVGDAFIEDMVMLDLWLYTQNENDGLVDRLKEKLSENGIAFSFAVNYDRKTKVIQYSSPITLFNNELTLLNVKYRSDKIGNQTPVRKTIKIKCGMKNLTAAEPMEAKSGTTLKRPLYNRALRNTCTFLVSQKDYAGQTGAVFRGVEYVIRKASADGPGYMELVCEEAVYIGG